MARDKIHSFNKYSLNSLQYAFRDGTQTILLYYKNTSDPPLSCLFPPSTYLSLLSSQNNNFTYFTEIVIMCIIRVLPLVSHLSLTFHLSIFFKISFYKDNIVLLLIMFSFHFSVLKTFLHDPLVEWSKPVKGHSKALLNETGEVVNEKVSRRYSLM